MRCFVPHVWCAVLAAAACNQGDDGDFDFDEGTATSTVTASTTAPTSGTDASTSSTGGDDDPATTNPDATGATGTDESSGGDDSTTEVLPTEPCTTIDVLIVIDNSDAMAEEQARLNVALSPFLSALSEQLPGVAGSIQVAVLTTDSPEFVTVTPAGTCTPYASAANWMSFGPMLSTELGCASAVGTAGDVDERPMQMAIEALSPDKLGVDGFNEGFLREQGPLVLLIVSDEEDDLEEITEWGSTGDPPDWIAALAATQGGYEQNVIPLALVGPIEEPNACPDVWNGVDGAETATRLIEFTESFPHHAVGDICQVEYTTFLNGAVPEIAAACNAWVPE